MNIGGAVTIKNKCACARSEIEYYSLKTQDEGKHSFENIMAAILAAREHGAKHDAIQRVIEITRHAHRLEYVRKVGGVNFFNDSKPPTSRVCAHWMLSTKTYFDHGRKRTN